ncbi:MAG: hypothetical protein ACE5J2_01205 [Nitrososphaerales archaeon]
MDARKQIAYGVLKLVIETVVAMALQRANKIPLAVHGIIKNGNGNGKTYICPYGDNHRFSHEDDMILHVTSIHAHSEIAKSLRARVIIN